ncbi:MAG TPA: acetyl-CoA carboxylase, biotin carboxyl carrier protein, partial [Alphaproteobacteria bacterium]|nr:acetyl-CoA carboxylase, biotin carboxyl carrier protein [Alphaproteobacteria bacterium]
MAKAPKASAGADTALVKALADILDDAGLAELEYETEAVTVRLSRVSGNMAPAMP